jgi:PIN domain nuclease of toxin-antitoxin system
MGPFSRTAMPLLLDTHAFIWLAWNDEQLSRNVVDAVLRPDEIIYVSVITRWEIALKEGRRGFRFGENFDLSMAHSEFLPLDLTFDVPKHLADLPPIHADPFDRMLIAQALSLDLTLVTCDRKMRQYPISTFW